MISLDVLLPPIITFPKSISVVTEVNFNSFTDTPLSVISFVASFAASAPNAVIDNAANIPTIKNVFFMIRHLLILF